MTLRDYFAGQADVTAVDVSDVSEIAVALGIPTDDRSVLGQLKLGAAVSAAMRYMFADAMIAERDK